MDFDTAFGKVLGHEGGLTLDPRDRGNWTSGIPGVGELKGTKFGIAAHVYPNEDIQNLSLERAKEIYKKDYWGPAGCDAVPNAIKFDLFDMAINSGRAAAIRTLQRAAGMKPHEADGKLGPKTLLAIASVPSTRLVARFNGERLLFMTDLPSWSTFSRGWAKRVARNLLEGV
jgi:lysozyme family protein